MLHHRALVLQTDLQCVREHLLTLRCLLVMSGESVLIVCQAKDLACLLIFLQTVVFVGHPKVTDKGKGEMVSMCTAVYRSF